MQKYLFFLGILSMILVACVSRQPQPSPSDIFGPSTATGTIVGTGASLYRRGTHVLLMNGHPRFYLESKQVNLQEFEGDSAVVRGEITANTHPSFLPVIEVESVTALTEEADAPLQKYNIPFLALSLEAPRTWKSTLTRDRLLFRLEEGGAPFVEMEKRAAGALPEGLPIRISGRNGVRIVEEGSGKHLVYVEGNADMVILFTFTPEKEDPITLRDAFYALLRTVVFAEEASSSSSVSSSSSSSSGPFIPCGGPAHVLCPAGMYCEVREFDTGIGACRQL